MPPMNILIKPASGSCNLQCRYCFYTDIASKREQENYGVMQQDTLETLVQKALSEAEESCGFNFQGGEPVIAGIDFYRTLVDLQQKYNHKNLTVHNSLQTNGTLIDKEFAMFLAKHHFLVGLSMDGPKEVNDLCRTAVGGKSSFSGVLKAKELFEQFSVEYNILCVVTASTTRFTEKIYAYYKKLGINYLQFIPCLDPFGEPRGGYGWSLTPEAFGSFLCKLYDLWEADFLAGRYISIRHFDNWLSILMGRPPESCAMAGICTCYFVVEANGDVFPCDFYVTDEYRLGNISTHSFAQMATSPRALDFVQTSIKRDDACSTCSYFMLCRCGCRRDREDGLSYFCKSYQMFFKKNAARLQKIAGLLMSGKV